MLSTKIPFGYIVQEILQSTFNVKEGAICQAPSIVLNGFTILYYGLLALFAYKFIGTIITIFVVKGDETDDVNYWEKVKENLRGNWIPLVGWAIAITVLSINVSCAK